jgi:alanine racemase
MSRNTIARIDLSALGHNLAQVRKMAPQSRIACVVKADGYGHGLSRVSAALRDADILAVATVDEGRRCRRAGWRGRLLLLEGPANVPEFEEMVSLGAEMVVHHETQLDLLRQRRHQIRKALWLKIDTGMHRLGFAPERAAAVHAELEGLRGPSPTVLMTHFACADEPHNPMTNQQIRTFDESVASLSGPASLANSAAVLNFPESQRDFVRPGIMLYGVSPSLRQPAADLGLRPVMTLQCDLIAINRCRKGDSIGYGAAYRCPEDMMVGVAAIGYGDGYPRHARNGTPVLLNGRRSALVGHVSMDMITVDLRGHEEARVGDSLTLWGPGLPVEEVAAWCDAIPYQLICGVTARVKSIVC